MPEGKPQPPSEHGGVADRRLTQSPSRAPRALLIAMIVFAVIVVAAVVYMTVGYETAEDHGAATPAPERLEDSPVRPDYEEHAPPAALERDEGTAPQPLRPEAQPMGPTDPEAPQQ